MFPTFFGGAALPEREHYRGGAGAGLGEVLHHRAEHDGERAFVVAVEHADAVRPGAVPVGVAVRRRQQPAPAGDRAVRHRANRAGGGLVNGGAADVPVGSAVPRHGGAHRAHLRVGANLAAQLRVPGGRQGGADGRRRLSQRLL